MADAAVKSKTGGLGRKVGPLPLWAWTLVAAAVLYYVFTRMSKGAATTAQAAPAATTGADTSTGLSDSSGGQATDAALQAFLTTFGQQQQDFMTLESQNQDTFFANLEAEMQAWMSGKGGAATGAGSKTNPNKTVSPGTPRAPVINQIPDQFKFSPTGATKSALPVAATTSSTMDQARAARSAFLVEG